MDTTTTTKDKAPLARESNIQIPMAQSELSSSSNDVCLIEPVQVADQKTAGLPPSLAPQTKAIRHPSPLSDAAPDPFEPTPLCVILAREERRSSSNIDSISHAPVFGPSQSAKIGDHPSATSASLAPAETLDRARGTSTNDNDTVKRQKEKFLMFARVLMKYLEQKDPAMHLKAKAIIKDCADRNKRQEKGYESVTARMRIHLHEAVGEAYWKRAEQYLAHFLKRKAKGQATESQTAVAHSIIPVAASHPANLTTGLSTESNEHPATSSESSMTTTGDFDVVQHHAIYALPAQTEANDPILLEPAYTKTSAEATTLALEQPAVFSKTNIPTTEDVNMKDHAVHALATRMGAHQPSSARKFPPSVALSAGSSVTTLATSRWTAELLAMMSPHEAFHLGRFITNDPDPEVSLLVQKLIQHKLANSESNKVAPVAMDFLDFSNESDRTLLQAKLHSTVSDFATRLLIPNAVAMLLLHDYNFETEDAFQSMLKDRQGTLDRLGLSLRTTKKRKAPDSDRSTLTCEICYGDFECDTEMFCLACQHSFCLNCFKDYIQSTLQEGLIGILSLTCPSSECRERLTIDDVLKISPEMETKWHEAYLLAFVGRSSDSHRYCPGPDCKMVAIAPSPCTLRQPVSATCTSCKTCFCMQCGESPHAPAECKDLLKFQSMFESCTVWIKKNTKPCPGCKAAVEKDGGCNAMHCTRCGTEFCWLCLSLGDAHSSHPCNEAEPEPVSVVETKQDFFAKRFQTHKVAERNAREQLQYWQQMPPYLADATPSMLQPQDIATFCKALETLVEARNFLRNSCVASHARKTNMAFETHLAALEASAEGLSQQVTEVYTVQLNDKSIDRRNVRSVFGMLGLHTLFVVHCLKRMVALAYVDD